MKFVVKMSFTLQTDFVHIRREQSCDLGNKYSVWFLKTEILKSQGYINYTDVSVFLQVQANYFTKTGNVGMKKH